jgi:hypothetical protein
MKMVRILLIAVLVGACAGSAFSQSEEASRRLAVANALAGLVGFGTGQYYLGRNGLGFLVGDAVGAGCVVGGLALDIYGWEQSGWFTSSQPSAVPLIAGSVLLVGGSAVYIVTRIWEIVDMVRLNQALRREDGVVGMLPTVEVRPEAVAFGVAITY